MAKKAGSGRSVSTKKASGKGTYRSAISGRFVGRTKDGINIIGPKQRSHHFTKKQAREAVDATRSPGSAGGLRGKGSPAAEGRLK